MNRSHKLFGWLVLLVAVWLMSGCGGSMAPPAPSPPPANVKPYTVLVVGGNEVFGLAFPPCVRNAAVEDGDSVSTLGLFQLGVLNTDPDAILIVSSAFELDAVRLGWAGMDISEEQLAALEYEARRATLDNLTGAVLHSTVAGVRVTLVGVYGADQFNAELRAIAATYGAKFTDTLPEVTCAN